MKVPTKTVWQQSSEVFHRCALEYDSWFDNSLLFAIELAAIKALTAQATPSSLEIGVGPGRFAEPLSTVFGVDPANAPLYLAAARNIQTCQAVGESLPFKENSFSRISLFFTLCFVQNPLEVLAEARRVLRNDGYLLLGIVPADSQWGQSLLKKKNSGHPFYEHARFFTVKKCKALLDRNGFSIYNSMSTLYQVPGSVTIMEQPQSGMDENAGFVVLQMKKNE